MHFNCEINIGMILTILAIAISVFFTIRAINENTRIRKANLLKDFILHLHGNRDLKEIFFRIEWGRFKFDLESFPQSEDEKKLTYLIGFFDMIAYYEESGLIDIRDLKRDLGYVALRLVDNLEVKKYFVWLDEWFKDKGVSKPSKGLRELANKLRT